MSFNNSLYRELFSNTVGSWGQDLDLVQAALYIAAEDLSGIDIESANLLLDDLTLGISKHLTPSMGLREKLDIFTQYLGVVQDFCGDTDDYYNPNNLYLNQVLDRKRGIPIVLCLIYMEVGSRLDIVFEPVGLPGHMVIRARDSDPPMFIDPFHNGKVLNKGDCVRLLKTMYGDGVELTDRHFISYSRREFLTRILGNLVNMHLKIGNYELAKSACDRIALVVPNRSETFKERSRVFRTTGEYSKAIRDLESYLNLEPKAHDAKMVRNEIMMLWARLARLN